MVLLVLYYLALIYTSHLIWCLVGLLLFSVRMRQRLLLAATIAAGLALFRLLLGLISGYMVFYEATPRYLLPWMRLSGDLLPSYFAIYVPVRLIEWAILAMLIRFVSRKEGASRPLTAICWIVGGVVWSCLFDLPMLGLEKSFAR